MKNNENIENIKVHILSFIYIVIILLFISEQTTLDSPNHFYFNIKMDYKINNYVKTIGLS